MKLTARQKQVLEFIKYCLRRHGYPPTRAEIAAHFKWNSKTAANDHLHALERRGYITIADKLSRGIAIVRR